MSKKELLVGILISVLITSALVLFVYPLLPLNKKGMILQTIYKEFDSNAFIYDSDTNYELMPQTTVLIHTSYNSKLRVTFSAMLVLSIGTGFQYGAKYNIILSVVGIQNKTAGVHYYTQVVTAGLVEIPVGMTIMLETATLPIGTYNISVFWRSNIDTSVITSLIAGSSGYQYVRSLLVEEIAVSNLFGF